MKIVNTDRENLYFFKSNEILRKDATFNDIASDKKNSASPSL